MLISEQLIARHLERGSDVKGDDGDKNVVEVFNILTLEEWAKKAATEDMPVAHAAADPMHGEQRDFIFNRLGLAKSISCRFSGCTADSQTIEDQNQRYNNLKIAKINDLASVSNHC